MTDAQIVMSILSSSWAFDSLPDTCKSIFKKFYCERKSMDEIAEMGKGVFGVEA